MDFLSNVLRDEELTSYLQYMVRIGCEFGLDTYSSLNDYFIGDIEKEELMDYLEFKVNVQKDKVNAAK